jgi:hypothetical protein
MIQYLARADHNYPVADYLKSWAGSSHPVIKVVAYEGLPTILPRGTYIFSDLERLSAAQADLATAVWDQLIAAGDGLRLLNHPTRSLSRFELLQELRDKGVNQFRAFRITEPLDPVRFPAFLRRADEHEGNLSGLLRDHQEVDQAIVRALLSGVGVEDLLLVEFCDTSQGTGLFRKYSAFRVGDCIIPRHLIFSQKWMLKLPDLLDPDKIAEEQAYLDANPHEPQLREIFDRAHIDYGRIDYSLLDGRIQVWEINTNPVVMLPRDKYRRQHLPAQEFFATRIRAAFAEIDSTGPAQPMVPINLVDCARRLRSGEHS